MQSLILMQITLNNSWRSYQTWEMFILDFAEKFKWLQQRVQDPETELKEKGKYETSRLITIALEIGSKFSKTHSFWG